MTPPTRSAPTTICPWHDLEHPVDTVCPACLGDRMVLVAGVVGRRAARTHRAKEEAA